MNMILMGLAAAMLILYLVRRRARLGDEDS